MKAKRLPKSVLARSGPNWGGKQRATLLSANKGRHFSWQPEAFIQNENDCVCPWKSRLELSVFRGENQYESSFVFRDRPEASRFPLYGSGGPECVLRGGV